MPGVAITLTNNDTGLTRSIRTRGNGEYTFNDLPIGTYTLTFTLPDFQVEKHPDVLIQANRTTTLNIRMKLGAQTETVEVRGTPLLNTVDTTNGYVLDSAQIEETPLGTGSFTQLATLSPGVNADFLADTGTNTGLGNQNIWANGQRLSSNTFTFDGVMANNLFNGASSSQVTANRAVLNTGENFLSRGGTIQTNTSVYDAIGEALPSPPQETISELRVNTSMFDSSQGATAGAHIDVTTKTGTNEIHGSLYGKYGNRWLNAAPYFFNQDTAIPKNDKVPDLHRGIAGITLGGPILKDKLFFFGGFQVTRVRDTINSISTAFIPVGLTDDRSVAALQALAITDANLPPNTPIDPVTVKLFNAKVGNNFLIPSFTNDGTSNGGNQTLFGPASTFDALQTIGNVNYNISNSDVLSGKYYFQRDPTSTPFPGQSTPLLGFSQKFQAGSQVVSIENSKVFSPNTTWEQKFGFLRMNVLALTAQPLKAADVGINLFGSNFFPGITIAEGADGDPHSFNSLSVGPSNNFANTGFVQNTFEGTSTFNWVLHSHTLSFGGNYDFSQLNIENRASQVAQLGFKTLADFFTGALRPGLNNSVFFVGPTNRYYRAPQVGAFAQDQWKVTSNIVLTLGLRYDWDAGLVEKNGQLVSFDSSKYSYDLATDTILNTGLVVAGNNKLFHTPGASDSTLRERQWGIGPRLGIAWNPDALNKKLVIRAGTGLYYDRGEYFTNFSPSAGFGFNGPFGVTLQPPFVQPVLTTPSSTFSNPFGTTLPPVDTNPADFINNLPNKAALINGATPYLFGAYDPHNKLPYTENWSFDLQYQATRSAVVTVGYTGNHGLHQTVPLPFNQPGIATASHPINGETLSYGYQKTPEEVFSTSTGGNTDLRAPFLGYSPNSVFWSAVGTSHYDALLASFKSTLNHGLTYAVSYTWSHTLDDSSGYGLFYNGNDPRNLASGYARSDFDRTHVTSISFDYELPKFAAGNGFVRSAINGFEINSISYLQSGQPYNVYDFSGTAGSIFFSANDFLTNPILPLAPGFTPKTALTGHSGANLNQPAFKPEAFAVPLLQAGTNGIPLGDNSETGFSTGGRNIFRGPFQKRADMSLAKNTAFGDRYVLRLNMDVFNITNTSSFDTPNNNVTASDFNGDYDIPGGFASGSVGFIQHTIGSPRQVQFGAKFTF